MPMEYVPSVTLQLWDGAEWRSEDRRCRRPKGFFVGEGGEFMGITILVGVLEHVLFSISYMG